LDTLAVKKIVVKFLDQLKSSVAEKNIRLFFSEPVIELLAEKGYDSKMGARPLNRKIDELIRVPLSRRILFEQLTDCVVNVELQDHKIVFELKAPQHVTTPFTV
jgi:ATP-dependent Clp protease ATP-binding subunit ClpA